MVQGTVDFKQMFSVYQLNCRRNSTTHLTDDLSVEHVAPDMRSEWYTRGYLSTQCSVCLFYLPQPSNHIHEHGKNVQGCSLFYFTSPEDFSPRGVIPLEQAEIAEGKRTQGIIDRRDKYIISVTVDPSFQCKKPVYLLSARSSSGQTEWLQVLLAFHLSA